MKKKSWKPLSKSSWKRRVPSYSPIGCPPYQFNAAGKPTKKIVDDQVKIVQTGTSPATPEKLADSWEAAAVAANNLNHVRNNIQVNGKITTIMFLSTRSEPAQEVNSKPHASRILR